MRCAAAPRCRPGYGGRFVQAINGLAGDQSSGMAGSTSSTASRPTCGAADYTLHPGDREWWDYRYWNDLIQVPVAIGAWPEPFVHGYGGHAAGRAGDRAGLRERASAAALRTRRRPRRYTGHRQFSVRVETFARAASALSASLWQGRGLTVSLHGGRVMVYRGRAGSARLRPEPSSPPTSPGRATGGSAALVVAGDTRPRRAPPPGTLAERPGSDPRRLRCRAGRLRPRVAYGGRP